MITEKEQQTALGIRQAKFMLKRTDEEEAVIAEKYRPRLLEYKANLEKFADCDVTLPVILKIWYHFGANANQYWNITPDSGIDAETVQRVAASFYKSLMGGDGPPPSKQIDWERNMMRKLVLICWGFLATSSLMAHTFRLYRL